MAIYWPPKELEDQYTKFQEWSALYSGSAKQVSNFYQGMAGKFWGKVVKEERATMLHLPVASDIAAVSANLLLSEMPDIKISEAHHDNPDSTAINTEQRLNTILDETDAYSRLLEAAETSSALGGSYIKINWNTDFKDYPILSVAQPDNVIPEFKWGFLQKLTFHKVIDNPKSNVYYRYLEIREPNRIVNQLWRGTLTDLGKKIPLSNHSYTKNMQDEVVHNMDDLLVRYFPNKKPNRLWRGSDLGQSDLSGIEGLLDSIDETYTSLMRDLRLGRANITIPSRMLEDEYGNLVYDIDKMIYTVLEYGPVGDDNAKPEMFQPSIRADEHIKVAYELLKQAYSLAGYSPSSFGIETQGGNATATEIKAKESKSFKTRNKKAKYFQSSLQEILSQLLRVDKKYFNSDTGEFAVQVNLQDSVQTDPLEKADSLNKLAQAKAMSIYAMVDELNSNWTDKQKQKEVDRIMQENGMIVNEPDDLV